jgi:predicted lipoprotein
MGQFGDLRLEGWVVLSFPARLVAATVCVLGLGAPAPADAALDDTAYRRVNESLVQHHIIPRYAKLAEASEALHSTVVSFCSAPDPAGLEALKSSYARAGDAWQNIQHVRFGPVELFMRTQRLDFWPDPRDMTARHLNELLGRAEPVTPEALARGSVAVQGFPALERLLFDDGAAQRLLAADAGAASRCRVLLAVTGNIAEMTRDIAGEWTTGENAYARVIADAGREGSRFAQSRDATQALFECLNAAIEAVAEQKLARPLGNSLETAQPRLTEAWRSGRSAANIRRNLEAAQAMYLGESADGFSALVLAAGDRQLDDLLKRAFRQTLASASAIDTPLADAIRDPARRPAVEKLARESAALRALLAQRLTAAIDIPLGFNSRDGD